MKPEIPAFLIERQNIKVNTRKKGVPPSYLDRTIHSLSKFILTSYMESETASREGLFQKMDSRIKIFFLIYFIVIVSLLKTLKGEILLGIMVLVLGIFSRLPLFQFYKKILVTGGIFGFLIPLPSALNLFSPGELLLPLFSLPKFLILSTSSVPERIGITYEGLSGVLMIACRVINSLSITLLVFYTTPFPELMRGLLLFRIPVGMVMVITLTYKYLFLFVKMILEIYLARKARYTGGEKSSMMRSWVAGRIVFLFQRSQKRFEELYRAMVSRGFTGALKAPSPRPLDIRNLLTGIFVLLLGILFLMV